MRHRKSRKPRPAPRRPRDVRIRSLVVIALLLAGCGDDDSAATTTLAAPEPPVEVLVDGIRWELPGAACLADTNLDAVVAAASTAADEVRALVADRASGWPTTTAALPGDEAGFYAAINRAGPVALSLAVLAGTVDTVTADWDEFESAYADVSGSPGPVHVIADRLSGWMVTASSIASAVPGVCG